MLHGIRTLFARGRIARKHEKEPKKKEWAAAVATTTAADLSSISFLPASRFLRGRHKIFTFTQIRLLFRVKCLIIGDDINTPGSGSCASVWCVFVCTYLRLTEVSDNFRKYCSNNNNEMSNWANTKWLLLLAAGVLCFTLHSISTQVHSGVKGKNDSSVNFRFASGSRRIDMRMHCHTSHALMFDGKKQAFSAGNVNKDTFNWRNEHTSFVLSRSYRLWRLSLISYVNREWQWQSWLMIHIITGLHG